MTAFPFTLTRLGLLMVPEPGNRLESEGVLNPGATWAGDGRLYLYPRLVAAGNRSCVGRARVIVKDGEPVGVERDGVALEAARGWEHGVEHGGVEDPRVTYLKDLGVHVMAYVAFGPLGPKPALALSRDGRTWERLGPIQFGYEDALDTDLNLFPNKDVAFFPETVAGPGGQECFALVHRPMWDLSFVRPAEIAPLPAGLADDRAGIWLSYVPAEAARRDVRALAAPIGHRFLAGPAAAWESLKIGAGPAPLRVAEGWLLVYHGVKGHINGGGSFTPQNNVHYSAGAMLLDAHDPSRVLARTAEPLLEPETADETDGTVANVVFPSAIATVEGRDFVFYGMADTKIGVARLDRL